MLRLLAGGAAIPLLGASGCQLLGSSAPLPRLLGSRTDLPPAFTQPLPIPPVLEPDRADATTDHYTLTAEPTDAEILPGLTTGLWGYGGRFPGPTIEARSGRPVRLQLRNQLPVPTVVHLHGGHTPPDSDGYPTDLVLPDRGEFALAHPDPRAQIVRGEREYTFPLEQRAATLWYHDHRMDFTGPQVWRGLAGLFIVRDDEEDALPLPSGDREIPLVIADRSFGAEGELLYPALDPRLVEAPGVRAAYAGGVLGDVNLVNGAPWPRLEVSTTRYRFRVLNAANARTYVLALDPPPRDGSSFIQIGSDGGLLTRPEHIEEVRIAPAERFDLVIDFGSYRPGDRVRLVNSLDDGSAGQVMQFVVTKAERDESAIPDQLSEIERLDPDRAVETREFRFESGDIGEHTGWLINGLAFDPTRMDAQPRVGTTEIWRLTSDVDHPIHLHLVHFQELSRDGRRSEGPPQWKDTIDLGAAETAEIIMRFTGYPGRYVFHCHNLEHEDMMMMANFEVVD